MERAFPSLWRETAVFALTGGLLLFGMTQPAFYTFFISENFEYLGQYRTHDNDFWRAVMSPTNRIFFRPVFFISSLPWHYVLPLDPLAYHLRNFAFSVVNLLLFHRILVRLVTRPRARALGFLFFALSKIHLTTIGYINIFDAIVTLMLLLSTILFFLRYIARRRALDYALGLLFCSLSVFTKDYGLVVVLAVAALIACFGIEWSKWRTQVVWWSLRLSPLLFVAIAYLGLRFWVVGALPSSDPIYSPQLSFGVTLHKLMILISTMGNLSLAPGGITGASGLGAWFTTTLQDNVTRISWGDAALCVGMLILFIITLVRGRRAGRALIFPLVLMIVYFAPTLLTRNLQMYYQYESVVAVSLALGLCLDRVDKRFLNLWSAAIIVIGINGAISNYTSLYGWQFVAGKAQQARMPVIERYRGQAVESITFLTTERSLWQFALGSKAYPLLPELMNLPGLEINYISHRELPTRLTQTNATNLLLDINGGFADYTTRRPAFIEESDLPSARSEASIMAHPNPVPEGTAAGSTTITWSVRYASSSEVYVSEDGGPERLFAQNLGVQDGSAEATWINAGRIYEFRLYEGTARVRLLAIVRVTRAEE